MRMREGDRLSTNETIKTEQTKAIRPNIHEVSERAKPTKQKKKFIYSKYDCV